VNYNIKKITLKLQEKMKTVSN